jgi:N-acetylmuramoyl-L-alanine amidase
MNSLLFYLLQVIAASGLLYGYYHFALRNKRFHRYNRFYLLMAVIISIVIPFLNIPVYFTNTEAESSVMLQTLQLISSPGVADDPVFIVDNTGSSANWFTLNNILYTVYFLASLVFLVRILFSFNKIRLLIKTHTIEPFDQIKFVNTDEPGTPFSFFRWLFWNRKIDMHSEKGEQIFRHELFHIQQKHSWDIVFIELLSVIFWVNPFFHFIRKEIKAIHEFLADEFAIKENNNWQYAELLLMQVLNTNNQLVNPFFHNQIKRRIAMITSSTKPSYQYLRKMMVLPIAALVIFLFAFTYKNRNNDREFEKAINSITVVVDAGHGGTDKGVVTKDGKYSEAALSLAIAKKIRQLAPDYNINVIMTRENENFPGGATSKNDALRKRIEITNLINPAAFISIHMNGTSEAEQKNRSGFESYITKTADNEPDLTLASVVNKELRDIYKVSSTVKYRENKGIFVLDRSNSPSLLLECGYINNPDDVSFFSSDNNQEKVARAILEGVVKFANTKLKKLNGSIEFYYDQNGAEVRTLSDTIKPKENLDNYLVVINGLVQEKRGMKNIDSALFSNNLPIEARIYKSQAAIDKYGEKGKDGVIEIFTNKEIISRDTLARIVLDNGGNGKVPTLDQWIKEIPATKKMSPTAAELKSWEDPKIYGVWIDAGRVNNADLKKYKASDFGWYNVSRLAKTATNYGKHVFQVSLYTLKYYNEKIATRDEKLAVAVKDMSHTVKLVKGEPLIVINEKPVSVGLNAEINNLIPAEKIKSISILKGKNATDKYGDKAKDGAIEIITKDELEIKEITLKPLGEEDNKVFVKTEVEASFPGGFTAWRKFLSENINATVPVDSGASAGTYTIVLQFIVDKEGHISDIKPTTKLGFGMEEECIRIMKLSPNWIPAKQNGQAVKAYRKQPFTFVIVDEVEDNDKVEEVVIVTGNKIEGKPNNTKTTAKPGEVKEVTVTGYKINKAEADKLSPIFPNPATNSITILYDSKAEVNGELRVYDISSSLKMVSKTILKKGRNNASLNVSSLANGTYIINVVDVSGKILHVYKMIKQ